MAGMDKPRTSIKTWLVIAAIGGVWFAAVVLLRGLEVAAGPLGWIGIAVGTVGVVGAMYGALTAAENRKR